MVTTVHLVGRAVTTAEDEAFQQHLWDRRGHQAGSRAKMFVDSFWSETFSRLCAIVGSADTRPDFIIGDYQCEAAKDVAIEYGVPYAAMFPQFPWFVPAPHVPGMSGLHERAVCTEGASWCDRLWEMSFPCRRASELIKIVRHIRAIRRESGLRRMPNEGLPDYLVLVNSFEGFEIARDLSPNCAAVGPLLAHDYPGLPDTSLRFLAERRRVAYVAFGTHVMVDLATMERLARALADNLDGDDLDGVILALSHRTRDRLQIPPGSRLEDIVEHRDDRWHVLGFAPQRAILEHPSTVVFVTHAGASSAMEALFHGTPMVSLAVYGDQLSNALRLERAGVGRRVGTATFSAAEMCRAVRDVVRDEDGSIARNVLRLRRIAHIASRRRHRAADLIEEHLYDWELRHEEAGSGSGSGTGTGTPATPRPMHLQSPSARLSWVKLYNLDIWLPLLALLVTPALLLRQVMTDASRSVAALVMLGVTSVPFAVFVLFSTNFPTLLDPAKVFNASNDRKPGTT